MTYEEGVVLIQTLKDHRMTTSRNEKRFGSGPGVEMEQQVYQRFGSGKIHNVFGTHCAGYQRENALMGLLSD